MTCCPCFCGFTLQVATKIIAILDMVSFYIVYNKMSSKHQMTNINNVTQQVISLFGGMTSGLLLFTLMFYREDLLIELYRDERLGRNYELRSFLKKPGMNKTQLLIIPYNVCAEINLFLILQLACNTVFSHLPS